MKWFFGCLLESSLFELDLLGQSTALHVGKQEGLDKVFDEGLVVVVASFKTLEVLVHLFFAEVGHDACLTVWGSFNGVTDDPVEVGVHCALVHLHNLLVETLLPGPDYIFCVSAAGLFDLPVSSFIFSLVHLLFDLLLLRHSHELLR